MCTRKEAIEIIVTAKRGNTNDLRKRIGRLYDSFVILGFITELLPVPKEVYRGRDKKNNLEWEATNLAMEKARFFRLTNLE